MFTMISFIYRSGRKISSLIKKRSSQFSTRLMLAGNSVQVGKFSRWNGIPFINIHRSGFCKIGNGFACNSGKSNPIGRNSKTYIVVGPSANLVIGNNVGISNSGLICYHSISIGNHVKMGGGVVIYDTDFHSLSAEERRVKTLDKKNTKTKPVIIEDDVFIGAHSTILKGVTIGKGAIVAACSVVTKDIPSNEVWGGNPAIKLR
jgi:acetyltransferase-like isoleucine patch superfamily enzyme